jgi:hypothetical protein
LGRFSGPGGSFRSSDVWLQIERIMIDQLSGDVAYAVYILLSPAEHCSRLTVVGHSCFVGDRVR